MQRFKILCHNRNRRLDARLSNMGTKHSNFYMHKYSGQEAFAAFGLTELFREFRSSKLRDNYGESDHWLSKSSTEYLCAKAYICITNSRTRPMHRYSL